MTEVPRATLRILIIDDDVMHARVVQRLLQNDGHETLTASSAEAAIQSLDGPSGFLPHASWPGRYEAWNRTGLSHGWPSGQTPYCSAISRSNKWT